MENKRKIGTSGPELRGSAPKTEPTVPSAEDFPTATLTEQGGTKRRIVELFQAIPIEDECSLSDVLYRLQHILEQHTNKPLTEEELDQMDFEMRESYAKLSWVEKKLNKLGYTITKL